MKNKLLIILASLCLYNCSPVVEAKPPYSFTEKSRITFYSTDPKWGNRVACQKTKVAREGVTIAAHPNFKFGTKVMIPALKGVVGNGEYIVQDRGPAITRKAASNGKKYVFDIYVSSHAKVRNLKKKVPMYLEVFVKAQ